MKKSLLNKSGSIIGQKILKWIPPGTEILFLDRKSQKNFPGTVKKILKGGLYIIIKSGDRLYSSCPEDIIKVSDHSTFNMFNGVQNPPLKIKPGIELMPLYQIDNRTIGV